MPYSITIRAGVSLPLGAFGLCRLYREEASAATCTCIASIPFMMACIAGDSCSSSCTTLTSRDLPPFLSTCAAHHTWPRTPHFFAAFSKATRPSTSSFFSDAIDLPLVSSITSRSEAGGLFIDY